MFRLAISTLIMGSVLIVGTVLAEEDEKPTLSEQAIAFAKDFKKNIKKMGEADILESIDKLVGFYKKKEVNEEKKSRKAILDSLGKAASLRNNLIVGKVMEKCGEMDDEALKLLLPVLGKELKKKEPSEDIYEAALESLGKLHSEAPTAVKALKDLLKNKEHTIVARSARAMAGYAGSSGKVRKDLFEEVLKQSEGVYSSAQGNNPPMERKWNIIGDDVMDALHKLSQPPRPDSRKFKNPAEARGWYNDNKKKSWDAKKK